MCPSHHEAQTGDEHTNKKRGNEGLDFAFGNEKAVSEPDQGPRGKHDGQSQPHVVLSPFVISATETR